jgi:hypothetical protein
MSTKVIKIDSNLKLGSVLKSIKSESKIGGIDNEFTYNSLKKILKETVQRIHEEDGEKDPELEKAIKGGFDQLVSGMSSIGKDAESKVDDEKAVQDALDDAPVLKKMVGESMNRRNRLLAEGNTRGALNEEAVILFIASLAIAMPKIIELVGKVVQWITNKLGGKNKVGEKIAHFGHWLHELVIKTIIKGLAFIPGFKKLPPDKQEKIAKVIHIVIVASLGVYSGYSAWSALEKGSNIMAGIEAAVAAVKAGELGIIQFITNQIKNIVGVVAGTV